MSRRQFFFAIVLVLIGLLGYGCIAFIVDTPNRQSREFVRKQIADVLSGDQNFITLSNQSGTREFEAFILDKDKLDVAHPYELSIAYSKGTNDFLRRIAGLRGAHAVHLDTTDVTDAGMQSLANLPDLEEIQLYHVGVRDEGIKKLAACPKLTSLKLYPREADQITIPVLLSLPQLTHLKLAQPYGDPWLTEATLAELGEAKNLTELTLISAHLPDDAIEKLRAKLPNCRIEVHRNDK